MGLPDARRMYMTLIAWAVAMQPASLGTCESAVAMALTTNVYPSTTRPTTG